MASRRRKQAIRALSREEQIPLSRAAALYDARRVTQARSRAHERDRQERLRVLEEAVRCGRLATASGATERALLELARDLRTLAEFMISDDVQRARALLDEALGVAQRLPTPLAEVVVLYRCARNEVSRRDWRAAEAAYRESLKASDEAGEDLAAAFVLGELARLHASTGNASSELDAASQALARYRRLGAVSAEQTLRELGRQLEQNGQAAALEWSRRALGGGRYLGIYPRLGIDALSFKLGAALIGPRPGPDCVAEMARLRVERGEAAGPLITRISDLGEAGLEIKARFDDFEIEDVGLMSE